MMSYTQHDDFKRYAFRAKASNGYDQTGLVTYDQEKETRGYWIEPSTGKRTYKVKKETIVACTWMKDRHGNYAYEGDHIRFWDVSYFDTKPGYDMWGDSYPEYVDGELSSYEGIIVFERGCFHVKNSDHLYQDPSFCDNPDDRLLPLFWLPRSTLDYVSQTARERRWEDEEMTYPEWLCRTYGITAEELTIRLSTFEILTND